MTDENEKTRKNGSDSPPEEREDSKRFGVIGFNEMPPDDSPKEPKGPEDCLDADEPLPGSEEEQGDSDEGPQPIDLKRVRDSELPQGTLEEHYEFWVEHTVLPFEWEGNTLKVAAEAPLDGALISKIEEATSGKVEVFLAPRETIIKKLGA